MLQFVTARTLFLCVGLANLIAAILVCRLLPQELVAYLSRRIFRLLYRVEVNGLEHFHEAGRKGGDRRQSHLAS